MSELTREKLLPCQFCGSEAKRKRILKIDHALCTRCGTCTGIGLWNTRSTPSALTARSEGFREGVEAAAKVCDAYLWAPVCAAAIRSLSPRETDATRCSISFEHPPHDYCDGNPGAKPLSAPSSEVAEMVRRLNSETVEAYRIGNAYIGSLLGQAAALLSKVGQGWERGHVGGGMYLPIPREATEFYIAWTDEAGITWRKNLLPLPPLPERP